mmetsp:Transcript_52776/g.84278  ORF Transcript_52776/g.84278 Transcript_52776/m.84278 type:complete len:85 (+) Transcript_52776:944-1198(+)
MALLLGTAGKIFPKPSRTIRLQVLAAGRGLLNLWHMTGIARGLLSMLRAKWMKGQCRRREAGLRISRASTFAAGRANARSDNER